MKPKLILLGVTRHTVEEALRLGADVIVFDTPSFISILDLPTGSCALTDAEYLRRSPESIVAIARAAIGGADACLTLTEVAMALSAEVNAFLGAPDNSPEAVRNTIDKSRMRARLDGVPHLRVDWARVEDPPAFQRYLDGADGSCVAKPVAGSASNGVARYDRGTPPPEDGYPYLVESELVGVEFSVEAFSQDGRHTVIGCTSSVLGPKGEATEFYAYGHTFPLALAEDDDLSVCRAVTGMLDALGVRHGVTHTEVMLTASGPRIIETHVRHGGGKILDLVHAALGVDMVRLAVAHQLGLDPAPHLKATRQRVAAVRFLRIPPGRLVHHAGLARASRIPDVIRFEFPWHLGDRVSYEDAHLNRPAFVMVAADSHAAAERALDAVEAEIEWEVAP
ncbi:hypothetical protein QR77_38010 [Streptomyces sp. 150FB]|uniref:ATP-grasp domain-containing protein n=1 Tax=Streptomyces sp. 150FB TaxID=1576605 RepID=UPI0005893550|nr:ATP-grasp domain-containing protein [Streptomyces sp. 150FB]KIF78047.1 hypothetical protein QR77_38010 [Streptomyces sp. 150FB]